MEIKNAETKLEQADSFLTKLKDILKKHWGILTLLGIAYFFYWVFTTDFEELPEENVPAQQIQQFEEPNYIEAPSKGKKKQQFQQQVQQEEAPSYYITKKTYIIDD
jgi:hypothetical protein